MPQSNEPVNLRPEELDAWQLNGNEAHVMASFRFVQNDFQCFSDWSKQDMKIFWNFIKKLHNNSWRTVLAAGGKVAKTGLAPTIIPINKYPDGALRRAIENEYVMFEFRVDHVKRIHGFRRGPVFYICWLDKNHKICA
ncbi:hypothetical protein [Chitinophaga sp.]|uniref:MAG6450 family protein n=1 Tax=Chitinophaga sp. TaxID=1869181 RepID=UPI0031D36CA8